MLNSRELQTRVFSESANCFRLVLRPDFQQDLLSKRKNVTFQEEKSEISSKVQLQWHKSLGRKSSHLKSGDCPT